MHRQLSGRLTQCFSILVGFGHRCNQLVIRQLNSLALTNTSSKYFEACQNLFNIISLKVWVKLPLHRSHDRKRRSFHENRFVTTTTMEQLRSEQKTDLCFENFVNNECSQRPISRMAAVSKHFLGEGGRSTTRAFRTAHHFQFCKIE